MSHLFRHHAKWHFSLELCFLSLVIQGRLLKEMCFIVAGDPRPAPGDVFIVSGVSQSDPRPAPGRPRAWTADNNDHPS